MATKDPDAIHHLKSVLRGLRVGTWKGEATPHKYVLLLAMARLLEQYPAHSNQFSFQETEPIFAKAFDEYLPHWPANRRHLEYPFYHLQRDGFWHLQLKPGSEATFRAYEQSRLTRARLIETVAYAWLDSIVFDGLRSERGKQLVEDTLMKQMGAPDAQQSRVGGVLHDPASPFDAGFGGTSLFEHERDALRAISAGIGGTGYLLPNIMLYDDQSRDYYEYDCILVSSSGIYVLELKHWSGHIRVTPYNWLIDAYRYRRDPHAANSLKCKLLKGLYEHRFPSYPRLWVESVVVLTNPDAVVENADSPSSAAQDLRHNATFASIDDLLSFLHRRDAASEHRVLSSREVEAVAEALRSQSRPPRPPAYSVPGYETVEFLARRPDLIELVARPVDSRSRGLSRFRVFRPPLDATPAEQERARRRARNALDAVRRIGDQPCIHRVWDVPNDDGFTIEGSDWSEAGTLADLLADAGWKPTVDEALAICRDVAQALDAAHRADVIHRAVKPAHILMSNGIPRLTDFDLSFHVGRPVGEPTVLPDSASLPDDGYIAPELLEGQDFDEGTDLYSLGVIAYQLLTGERPSPTTRAFVAAGGRLSAAAEKRLADKGVEPRVIAALRGVLLAEREARSRDARGMAEAFGAPRDTSSLAAPPVPNARLQPGDTYDLYEIVAFLGQGSESQTYRARTYDHEVALKLFHREVPRERVFREQRMAIAVRCEHVVRCDGRMGHWHKQRYFIAMEYVEGGTLRQRVTDALRPDAQIFRQAALDLLDGLEALHGHRTEEGELSAIVHGDIKPDNILFTHAGGVKIADFSVAGPPRVDDYAGTSGYVPPDKIIGRQMQYAPDGDLFALGVSLWEWVFGARPYTRPSLEDVAPTPDLPAEHAGLQRYLPWLRRAVATREADRFSSASEMRQALLDAERTPSEDRPGATGAEGVVAPPLAPEHVSGTGIAPAPEGVDEPTEQAGQQAAAALAAVSLVDTRSEPAIGASALPGNPFVHYLNTLSSYSAGNANATAEAQVRTPMFERIHVANPLTDVVYRWLVDERRNVLLTGNAGDGKTTIAAEVYQRLKAGPLPSQARIHIPDHGVVIVKDMSELTIEERPAVLRDAADSTKSSYLIVTNTGTLLESARSARLVTKDPSGVQSELLGALERDEAVPVLDDRFLLLNVGRTDSIAVACAVLDRILAKANWGVCEACAIGETCPLYANVLLLQERQETVVRRVELVYRRLYEYGVRLTMRQMTGHLAYALTAGHDCSAIGSFSDTRLQETLDGSLFHNRFFGDDGERAVEDAQQLLPVREVRATEFGLALEPTFEWAIWQRQGERLGLAGRPLEALRRLDASGEYPGPAARRQARRLAYFLADLSDEPGQRFLAMFLRSPRLNPYLQVTRGGGLSRRLEAEWRSQVLEVLQEYYSGVRLAEGRRQAQDYLYLTLNRRSAGSGTQAVLARFGADEFQIVLEPGHRVITDSASRLVLQRRTGKARLALDLPFLDYVAARYEGELAVELSAFYADRLERFGAALLAEYDSPGGDGECLELLRIDADRRLRPLRIAFSDGHLEVL